MVEHFDEARLHRELNAATYKKKQYYKLSSINHVGT